MMAVTALGAGLALPLFAQSSAPSTSSAAASGHAKKASRMPVYPIPQKMTRSGGSVTVPALKLIGAKDAPTMNALKSMFALSPNGLPFRCPSSREARSLPGIFRRRRAPIP